MTGKQWLFLSLSDVWLRDLQGGVDDTISLTAYITAALMELHLEKNVSRIWTPCRAQEHARPFIPPRVCGFREYPVWAGERFCHFPPLYTISSIGIF